MAGRIKDREDREVYSAPWIGGGERSEPSPECLSCHMTLKVNPVTLSFPLEVARELDS